MGVSDIDFSPIGDAVDRVQISTAKHCLYVVENLPTEKALKELRRWITQLEKEYAQKMPQAI